MAAARLPGQEYLVRASFLEIYNEDVRDLLSKTPDNKLELKETVDSGVYVKDLTSFVVKGVQEINNVLAVRARERSNERATQRANRASERTNKLAGKRMSNGGTERKIESTNDRVSERADDRANERASAFVVLF